ncbi:MAG: hypothetical protein A2X36_09865 [Elusimicrobia bacterium GWA2_69_24]|nr:MAG: hypothetical protein A2X36_09865 [Elusimicrobia bacterium GWA2_69_24]
MDRLRVVFSFALIFGFSCVDSAISPMVDALHLHFGVDLDTVLLLISASTAGIVIGVLAGPSMTSAFRVSRLLAAAVVVLTVTHALFLLAGGFGAALAARFFFGLASGTIAGVMWWLAFHGVSKEYYPAMIVVLMSARPLAAAIGVPAAGLAASRMGWQVPFWALGAVMAAGGAALVACMPAETEPKKPISLRVIVSDYAEAFRLPQAAEYYIGFTVNRMCYFGFYSFAGIWFIRHYGLSLDLMSAALLVIGLAEAVVNFLVPGLLRRWGHRRVFPASLAGSALVLPFFIFGKVPLAAAVALIAVFMTLDRIYCMAAIITIPRMFPSLGNKTVFGSLNTLTAWVGLTVISSFEARCTQSWGLPAVESVLVACFLLGSALIYLVQHRTVLRPGAPAE